MICPHCHGAGHVADIKSLRIFKGVTLTVSEGFLVAYLLTMPDNFADREQLMSAVYGNRNNQPDDKIIDVFMSKIRKKLRPVGIIVEGVWGRGYRLREDKQEAAE